MKNGLLDGTVVILTGGGSGLGRALVRRFVDEGAHVGILERHLAKADSLREEFGESVVVVTGSVENYQDNLSLVDAAYGRFGRVDTFIANAGIFDFHQPLSKMDGATISASFDEIFNVNVKGVLLGARAVLPKLVQTRGSLLVTLSCAAYHPGGGGALYTASKHALMGVVRQLAYEFAPIVRVNGVAPGAMRTDLEGLTSNGTSDRRLGDSSDFDVRVAAGVPLGRTYSPEDYCGPYVMLASRSDSIAMTGAVVRADGGLEVRGVTQIAGGVDLLQQFTE